MTNSIHRQAHQVLSALLLILPLSGFTSQAHAEEEQKTLTIAQQWGVGYIPAMVVEEQKLIEKHAAAAGLGDIEVKWTNLAGGAAMNMALISGNLDIAAGGLSPAILLWNKTKGRARLVAAACTMPEKLTTTNPNVKSIRDLTSSDKIALPAVRVSDQARFLQMAAAKEWGAENFQKLDKYTVTMSHPDGFLGLTNRAVTGHFTVSPFADQEGSLPNARTILSSYEVMGGPVTATVYWSTDEFHDGNPKLYSAFIAALKEGMEIVNADKRAAADLYVRVTKTKLSADEIHEIITQPGFIYSTEPHKVDEFAAFLRKVGAIDSPVSRDNLFYAEVFEPAAQARR